MMKLGSSFWNECSPVGMPVLPGILDTTNSPHVRRQLYGLILPCEFSVPRHFSISRVGSSHSRGTCPTLAGVVPTPCRQMTSENVKNLHFPRAPDPLPPFLLGATAVSTSVFGL